jgi:hypothetical protein
VRGVFVDVRNDVRQGEVRDLVKIRWCRVLLLDFKDAKTENTWEESARKCDFFYSQIFILPKIHTSM